MARGRTGRQSACQPRPASCPWGCQGEPATVTGEEGTEPRLGCHHLRPNLPRAVALPGTCAGWWVAPPTPPRVLQGEDPVSGLGQRGAGSSALSHPGSLHWPRDPPVLGQPRPPRTVGTVWGARATGTRVDPEPGDGLFSAMSRERVHPRCLLQTAVGCGESVKVLTLPPPGTCLILSFEPHLDWTLLRSSFLLIICTFDSQRKG